MCPHSENMDAATDRQYFGFGLKIPEIALVTGLWMTSISFWSSTSNEKLEDGSVSCVTISFDLSEIFGLSDFITSLESGYQFTQFMLLADTQNQQSMFNKNQVSRLPKFLNLRVFWIWAVDINWVGVLPKFSNLWVYWI